MTRIILLVAAALLASGCSRSDDDAPSPAPSATPDASSTTVAFDPAFVGLAGSWRSEDGSLSGGRYLQIDIASAGAYSIDVRRAPGGAVEVLETGRGQAAIVGDALTGTPARDQKGAVLNGLGAWSARTPRDGAATMTLVGADGTRLALEMARR